MSTYPSYKPGAPAPEIHRRVFQLQKEMAGHDLDGILIMQPTDLFYFSGTFQQGQLYIPVEGQPLLMVKKDRERAKSESPLSNVVGLDSPKKAPELIRDAGINPPRVMGLEMDVLPANFYLKIQSIFSKCRIMDASHLIRKVRAVKSPFEIEQIKKAARMSERVAQKAKELICEGKTELTLAGELEGFARSLGHQGAVRMRLWGSETFYGHVMAGASAAVPSYAASPTGGMGPGTASSQGASWAAIQRNSPVLVDLVCIWEGYISDMARIYSIGPVEDELMRAHDAMLEVYEKLASSAVAGIPAGTLYDTALELAESKGYGDHFMGAGPYRIRFVGHGVGLELDEYPFLAAKNTMPLEEHMVVALEPKLIFPGKGVVGVENTCLVTSKGMAPLNRFEEKIVQV